MQEAWNAKPSLDFFLGASEASQKAINRDLDSGDLGQFSNQQGQGYERTWPAPPNTYYSLFDSRATLMGEKSEPMDTSISEELRETE